MISIKNITTTDLEKIKGGASVSIGTCLIIATVVVFLSGLIEGITNPKRCQG